MAEKSKLEMAVSIATLVVAAWWGYVGFVYSRAKDNFDSDTKRFDIIYGLFQKCTSQDVSVQQTSLKYFGILQKDVVGKDVIAEIFGGPEKLQQLSSACIAFVSTQQVDAKLVGEAPSPAQTAAAENAPAVITPAGTVPSSPSAPPNQGDKFWIFVGTYKAADSRWSSKYVTIDDTLDPTKFIATSDQKQGNYKVLSSVTTLNVRFGSFGPSGEFPPPTNKPFKANQDVHLRSMARWFDSDSWWATIDPPK